MKQLELFAEPAPPDGLASRGDSRRIDTIRAACVISRASAMRTSNSRSRPAAERLVRGVIVAALCTTAVPDAKSAAQPTPETPRESGIVETTRVALLLLDVEVVDRDGRPIHGLTRADFTVQLNWREYPIYSVDNLCRDASFTTAAATASTHGEAGESSAGAQPATSASASASAVRYVLYFDYAHLDADDLLRFVAGEAGPQFRLAETALVAAVDCFLLLDPLQTEGLSPGSYEYFLRWSRGADKERIERRLEFRIVEPTAALAVGEAQPETEGK